VTSAAVWIDPSVYLNICVSRAAPPLQELQYARELAEWDAKIATRMDELVVLTRENTACLNAVSELTSAQRKLETGLTATRKGLFADPVQQRKAEVGARLPCAAVVRTLSRTTPQEDTVRGLRRTRAGNPCAPCTDELTLLAGTPWPAGDWAAMVASGTRVRVTVPIFFRPCHTSPPAGGGARCAGPAGQCAGPGN
jgi:hypothetical protein